MMDELDLMQPDRIKEGLGTEILGKEIISYAEIGSTNEVALGLAAEGMKEGTLVIAEYQTAGKGRRKRKWLSPNGTSILASLILRPHIMVHEAHVITLISAASVAQAIRSVTQLPALIKWPNDVTIRDRKISGVLPEMRTEGKWLKSLVVGVGITVNLSRNRFPKEIRDVATSLSDELGHNVSRVVLLQEFLRQLESRYLKVKEHKTDVLMAEWKSLSATIGRQVQINLSRRIARGYASDIDETGALLVKTDAGRTLRVTADEVEKLRAD
jgi:BirA family biotin operon repressor/biotin-[acetyl-CoA-carboxylase] ligase